MLTVLISYYINRFAGRLRKHLDNLALYCDCKIQIQNRKIKLLVWNKPKTCYFLNRCQCNKIGYHITTTSVSTWLYRCQLWHRYVYYMNYVSLCIFYWSICIEPIEGLSLWNFQRLQPNKFQLILQIDSSFRFDKIYARKIRE